MHKRKNWVEEYPIYSGCLIAISFSTANGTIVPYNGAVCTCSATLYSCQTGDESAATRLRGRKKDSRWVCAAWMTRFDDRDAHGWPCNSGDNRIADTQSNLVESSRVESSRFESSWRSSRLSIIIHYYPRRIPPRVALKGDRVLSTP